MEETALTDMALWRDYIDAWQAAYPGDLPDPPPRPYPALWRRWWNHVETQIFERRGMVPAPKPGAKPATQEET